MRKIVFLFALTLLATLFAVVPMAWAAERPGCSLPARVLGVLGRSVSVNDIYVAAQDLQDSLRVKVIAVGGLAGVVKDTPRGPVCVVFPTGPSDPDALERLLKGVPLVHVPVLAELRTFWTGGELYLPAEGLRVIGYCVGYWAPVVHGMVGPTYVDIY